MNKSIETKDFLDIQRLIVYGSCYTCQSDPDKGQTILDSMNKK